jgi:hypothetical protein
MTRLPRLPDRTSRVTPEQRDATTFFALVMVLMIGSGMFALLMFVLVGWPAFIIAGMMAGAGMIFVLHYVLWGRMLSEQRTAEDMAGWGQPPEPTLPLDLDDDADEE